MSTDGRGYSDSTTTLEEVRRRLDAFNAERDWQQFHEPKDLAMCLASEAGELLEPFLWKRADEELDTEAIAQELADVLICALNLSAKLEIDLLDAVDRKIVLNGERYPVEKARGSAAKHDQL